MVLACEEHQRQVVAACCAIGARRGVRVGMTVSQARVLLSGPVHLAAFDPALVHKALRWLAAKAIAFTPSVALDAPDGLWLDLTGCTHLFGGRRRTTAAVVRRFRALGFEARAATAPCFGAAWALARFGPGPGDALVTDDPRAALGPLPIAALRLPAAAEQALHEVGVTTVEQVLRIPRAELARRHGPEVTRRLDQALGREPEVFTPIRVRPVLTLGQSFAGPTDRTEAIDLCVRGLLGSLQSGLERRESGCRAVVLTLLRADLPPASMPVRATRHTRDAKHWYTLLRPHLERAHLGFGVEGVTLTARDVRALAHAQSSRWIDTPPTDDAAELDRLADTLAARLGSDRVVRLRPRASFIPERSWSAHAATDPAPPGPADAPAPVDRPSRLLARPVPLDVVYLFPEGPIGRVTRAGGGASREVIRCRGPERISGEWWRREFGARDYYQLQTEDGAWLWVFRAGGSGRWFLHGEWV